MKRRTFLGLSATSAMGLFSPRTGAQEQYDVVVHGGTVYDGTGNPPVEADIGIVGDTIVRLGALDRDSGRELLDAGGLAITPGFIDIHSHSDRSILTTPTAESRVMQGITTEVTGNCGSSAAPNPLTGVSDCLARLDSKGVSVNQALLLGQGTLRENAVDMVNRPLTDGEMESVRGELHTGMEQGAFGLSTGLEYAPGRFTPREEIVALAQVVAEYDGLYASHMRNEEASLLEAVDEALEVGRATGVRVQVSHLKAAGKPNWPLQEIAIRRIEDARRAGVNVMADAYPYTAYSTGLTIFLSDWAVEDGTEAMLGRFTSPELRSRICREIEPRVLSDPGGYQLVVIGGGVSNNPWALGMHIAAIAERWDVSGAEAIVRLLEEEDGAVSFVGHGMSPENVARVLSHPLVMIGSDGASMRVPEGEASTQPHPRSYGTCARVLERYVRELGILDPATAIAKMTSMPARQVGLKDRGILAEGMKADLVLVDLAKVRERSTYSEPHRYPDGIPHVLVNGRWTVRDGGYTGARAGRALRRG